MFVWLSQNKLQRVCEGTTSWLTDVFLIVFGRTLSSTAQRRKINQAEDKHRTREEKLLDMRFVDKKKNTERSLMNYWFSLESSFVNECVNEGFPPRCASRPSPSQTESPEFQAAERTKCWEDPLCPSCTLS